jgi:diacylglycerol kinase family enzyme
VTLLDDRFEVVLFEGRYAVRYVKYFAGLLVNRLIGMKGITVMRAESVKLFSTGGRQVYVQTDGELACHLPAELRIVPHALTLMVPADYPPGTAPGN